MHSSILPATGARQPLSPCQLLGWVPSLGALCQAWGVGSIPQGAGGISLVAMLTDQGTRPFLVACKNVKVSCVIYAVFSVVHCCM